jgi:6-phospho-3-hexuloisomerase
MKVGYREYAKEVIDELNQTLSKISTNDAEAFVSIVNESDEVFVCGAGRSCFMARGFCMRLMHM